jgi:hypothetical protein
MRFRRALASAGVGAVLAATTVFAQTPAGTESQPVALPPEKQSMIRDHVRQSNFPAANLSEPARVDMVVPPEVDLIVLPQDVGTAVPTTTSYQFMVASDVIAVVEPESRRVIQLIQR